MPAPRQHPGTICDGCDLLAAQVVLRGPSDLAAPLRAAHPDGAWLCCECHDQNETQRAHAARGSGRRYVRVPFDLARRLSGGVA